MVTIQIRNDAGHLGRRGAIVQPGVGEFAGNRASLQFRPFGPRYWANGRVEKESSGRVVGRCSFSFVR